MLRRLALQPQRSLINATAPGPASCSGRCTPVYLRTPSSSRQQPLRLCKRLSSAIADRPLSPEGEDSEGEPEPDTGAAVAAAFCQYRPLDAGLYVVGTPIGNLEDISFRALRILKSVSAILAEDTRRTRRLLDYYGIKTHAISFHAFNEKQKEEYVLGRLRQGEPLALVSDAGMPAISDPGSSLVAAAVAANIRITPVPGPCAAITALVAAGLPTEAFHFVGFLPPKSGARRRVLEGLVNVEATLVVYVPPHGLGAVLTDMGEVLGAQRRCCVAREMTKLHEEHFRATLEAAAHEFTQNREPKGEICVVVEGAPPGQAGPPTPGSRRASVDEATIREAVQKATDSGQSVSGAARTVARELGCSRSTAYRIALEVTGGVAVAAGTAAAPVG